MSSEAGGNAQMNNILKDAPYQDESTYQPLVGGSGFACFSYLMASISAFIISFYYSPQIFGSTLEKDTLKAPQDIEPLRPSSMGTA